MAEHEPGPILCCRIGEPGQGIILCPLHAAAPALLEVLERIVAEVQEPPKSPWDSTVIKDARAVIAQTKGT